VKANQDTQAIDKEILTLENRAVRDIGNGDERGYNEEEEGFLYLCIPLSSLLFFLFILSLQKRTKTSEEKGSRKEVGMENEILGYSVCFSGASLSFSLSDSFCSHSPSRPFFDRKSLTR
jgi:hypothetical protein